MMDLDTDLLQRFEEGLDPQNIERSPIPAKILGYGEISTIFQIEDNPAAAYKRMPLFDNLTSAERYIRQFREYCAFLKEAGLKLPQQATAVIEIPDRPIVLYIAQEQLPREGFGHNLLHTLGSKAIQILIERVSGEILKTFSFNRKRMPQLEIALDGQISNWYGTEDPSRAEILYIDTSTPLYRKNGQEQLDPELILQSAPWFLKWIIRMLFLKDVMNRYYDERQVYIDMAANLYKEQRHDLIPIAVETINAHLHVGIAPVTAKEIKKYYQEDKLIWILFLAFRKIDRGLKTSILRKRYEFILPDKIKR